MESAKIFSLYFCHSFMHDDEKFFHNTGFVFMVFVVKKYLTFRGAAIKFIVNKVFKRRELAYQNITDKCCPKLCGSRHVSR